MTTSVLAARLPCESLGPRRSGNSGIRNFTLFDDDGADKAYAFLDDDDSAVMVRVVSGTDPVELGPASARELAAALIQLADELDRIDRES